MNKLKRRMLIETDTPIYVNNTQVENVESYIYLGQKYSTRDNKYKDIQRRITAGWTAFAKNRDIFKINIGTCFGRQIYKSCVIPAVTYGAETWALTIHGKNKLAATITNMERSMLNTTYRERKTNIWVLKKQVHRRD